MKQPSDSTVVLRWSRHRRSVGHARAKLRTTLATWGESPVTESAVLVLSELLTNAVRHGRVSPGREIETRFLLVDGRLRIEVHDASPVTPQECGPDPHGCGGRGLLLVAAVAESWGFCERTGPGKVVWAELGLVRGTEGAQSHDE